MTDTRPLLTVPPTPEDESAGTALIARRVKVERAYEQLADALRESIHSGALRVGDRLPSETKLGQDAGVSRSTVREALRILQEAGLIERTSPKVMVVRRQSEESSHREVTAALHRRNVTFHHLHEALLTIEPELTRLATERADAGDIRELQSNLEAQQRNLENFAEWCRLDADFHLTIAEMSANPALIVTRGPLWNLLLPVLNRFISSTSLTGHALRYHHRILAEIEARDSELAAAVSRRHVNDFRVAWEKAGLDFDMQVADLGDRL
jgi:GntR family transcriptional regulator, transcriptional repressor for pyruvate dehydrogenase complex